MRSPSSASSVSCRRAPAVVPPPSTAAYRSIRRWAIGCASPRGRSWSRPSAATSATRCGSEAFARTRRSLPTVRVDDLLGKHFAILGTTGTGKSCTTALILRSILQRTRAAHIVLLDPHNEYAPAFGEWAEVISQRNMQLPYWLLTFEELVEVLVGDPLERKAEVEILQELIPIAKARYGAGRAAEPQRACAAVSTRAATPSTRRFLPYLRPHPGLIDERMGKLENRKDLAPYRQLRPGIETSGRRTALCLHVRLGYGLRQHGAGAVAHLPRAGAAASRSPSSSSRGCPPRSSTSSSRCSAAWRSISRCGAKGKVPVTVVCEEAHRYVPSTPMGFEPCKRAISKIAQSPAKGASTAPRCASSRSARRRSIRPSCRSATPCSPAHVQRSRPGPSCLSAIAEPGRACSSSCRRWATAKPLLSATACRCRCASSSTSCPGRIASPRKFTARSPRSATVGGDQLPEHAWIAPGATSCASAADDVAQRRHVRRVDDQRFDLDVPRQPPPSPSATLSRIGTIAVHRCSPARPPRPPPSPATRCAPSAIACSSADRPATARPAGPSSRAGSAVIAAACRARFGAHERHLSGHSVGVGTRLWPLSRAMYPKQFIRSFDDRGSVLDVARDVAGVRLRGDFGDQRPPGPRHIGGTQVRSRHHGHDDAGDGRG